MMASILLHSYGIVETTFYCYFGIVPKFKQVNFSTILISHFPVAK